MTVCLLDIEHGLPFIEKTLELSKEGQAIHKAMEELGLMPMHERARIFTVYSPGSSAAFAIGIIPFTSKDLTTMGGLSISQGGHAKGVVVHMEKRTELTGFTTLDVVNGEVKPQKFSARQLKEQGAKRLATEAGTIRSEKPLLDLSVRQVRSITDLAYGSLLTDESSRSVHPAKEVRALRGNTKIVSDISQFVLLRSASSPGGCSCSSSCWGCSSCSCSWG
jgi:hypothetical protein